MATQARFATQQDNQEVAVARLSRRALFQALTALALPVFPPARARASAPVLPPDLGKGRSVAIIGAGVAGPTAGWMLARHGFRVTIYEADNRYGGRSLSPRPVRREYQDWWFDKYDPARRFPKMYVSEFQEDPARSPDPRPQVCRFDDPRWDPQSGKPPQELFLNAGPGRIPSAHVNVIALCEQIGVPLEVYVFQSVHNLLQSDKFNAGQPVPFQQVNYSLRGQVAELAATAVKGGQALASGSAEYRDKVLQMLSQFGDLASDSRFAGSTRLGYGHLPGGWRDAPQVNPVVPLAQTIDSGFVGSGNPITSPGSFLFNMDFIDWQPTAMQPGGGMDRIWQQLLLQEIPAEAVMVGNDDPRDAGLATRDGGRGPGKRYVGDLVVLNHRATAIHDDTAQQKIRIDVAWTDPAANRTGNRIALADFCICTMAPNLLAQIPSSLPDWFRAGLAAVTQTAAIKVGWQAGTRFWEKENRIYGGISWTDDIIGQIWYPSDGFTSHTGVLTGAYNRGPLATQFSQLSQAQRIQVGLAGGEKLHAGFTQKVYADRGLTVAWHMMPFQVGGWASDTASTQPDLYRTITTLPQGRLYLAGDHYSYLPGWQEGSVTSVHAAINALANALH